MSHSEASLEILRRAHTALVSDIFDDRGMENPMLPPAIHRVAGRHGHVVVGPAFPCRVEPTDEYVEIDVLLEMVGSIPPGAVPLVASVDGFPAALWGGLMSAGALYRGAAGAVTTGAIRDVDQITAIGFDVFGTGTTALDIRRRGAMRAFDVAVEVEGRRVEPGDLVVADGNGVAILPAALVDSIAEECHQRINREQASFEGLGDGVSPSQIYAALGHF
jgi:4-hydroxy-4-methyl-2-oxoglutarate aldolase